MAPTPSSPPDQGVHDEGRARGEGADELAPPDEDFEQALHDFIDRLMEESGRRRHPRTSRSSPGGWRRTAPSTPWRSCCSASRRPASRTPTRAPSCGRSRWWIRTTGGRWTTSAAAHAGRARATVIRTPEPGRVAALLRDWRDGRIKLLFTALALKLRAPHVRMSSSRVSCFRWRRRAHGPTTSSPTAACWRATRASCCCPAGPRAWPMASLPEPGRLGRHDSAAAAGAAGRVAERHSPARKSTTSAEHRPAGRLRRRALRAASCHAEARDD
jgi:hypothetical protein